LLTVASERDSLLPGLWRSRWPPTGTSRLDLSLLVSAGHQTVIEQR
jgi:hypothetical protein